MINTVEGNFLHIDFGHFLEHKKEKFGYLRERDPFVFTPEIAYFVNGQSCYKPDKSGAQQQYKDIKITRDEYIRASQEIKMGDEPVKKVPGGREIAPEQMTKNMEFFKDCCCKAYHYLRQNANQLINLFLIMLSAGMPELKKKEEIQRLVIKLDINSSEQEANKKFKEEIDRA